MAPMLSWAQPPRLFENCDLCDQHTYQSSITVTADYSQPNSLILLAAPIANATQFIPIANETDKQCSCKYTNLLLQFRKEACIPTSILVNQVPQTSVQWNPTSSVLTIESLDFNIPNTIQILFDCSSSAGSTPKQIALEKTVKGGLCMVLNVEKTGDLTGALPAAQWTGRIQPPLTPQSSDGWGWKYKPAFGFSHTGFFATHWGWQTQIGFQGQSLNYELPAELLTVYGDSLSEDFDQARWQQLQLVTGPVAQYTLHKWRGQLSILAGIQTQGTKAQSIEVIGHNGPLTLLDIPSHSFRGILQPSMRIERLLSPNWSIWVGANVNGYLSTPANLQYRNPDKSILPGGRFDISSFEGTPLEELPLKEAQWAAQLGITFQFVPKKLQNPCGNQ
jgi:hypothetical protein